MHFLDQIGKAERLIKSCLVGREEFGGTRVGLDESFFATRDIISQHYTKPQ